MLWCITHFSQCCIIDDWCLTLTYVTFTHNSCNGYVKSQIQHIQKTHNPRSGRRQILVHNRTHYTIHIVRISYREAEHSQKFSTKKYASKFSISMTTWFRIIHICIMVFKSVVIIMYNNVSVIMRRMRYTTRRLYTIKHSL